jgi:hypothetical protein
MSVRRNDTVPMGSAYVRAFMITLVRGCDPTPSDPAPNAMFLRCAAAVESYVPRSGDDDRPRSLDRVVRELSSEAILPSMVLSRRVVSWEGAMRGFVGRGPQIAKLNALLDGIGGGTGGTRGRCVMLRGRRRVGKSRLVEEFSSHAGVPAVFFTASRQGRREIELFTAEVAESDLPGRDLLRAANPNDWDAALQLLAAAVPDDEPAIVVFDEFPYLLEGDASVDATFQKHWDRSLSKKPVLLILVGSDLAMMEELNTHGRAFYQRGTEMVVPPLSPVENATIVGMEDPDTAFDTYLVTGGLPLICQEWP